MSSSQVYGDARAADVEGIPDPSIVKTPRVSDPWTVEKAVAAFITPKSTEGSSSPVPFFHLLERLKTTQRAGWLRFRIKQGESVADHTCRMAQMTICAPPSIGSKIDRLKCTDMCLYHDVAETLVGDITPVDGVSKAEKTRRESEVIDYIAKMLPGDVGKDIKALWYEFEEGVTLESQFVQDLDKIDLLLQTVEYESRGQGKIDLSEFTYVATKLYLPEMKGWAKEIVEERDKIWAGKKLTHEGTLEEKNWIRQMQDRYYGPVDGITNP